MKDLGLLLYITRVNDILNNHIMKVLINIRGKGRKEGVLSHYEGIRPYLSKYLYYYNSNGNYRNRLMNLFIFPFELVKIFTYLNKI
jgi:hypothetical protein